MNFVEVILALKEVITIASNYLPTNYVRLLVYTIILLYFSRKVWRVYIAIIFVIAC